MLVRAFFILCLSGAALSARSFPDINVLNSYSTEVQLSLVREAATIYVKEYHDILDKRGSVSIYMQGAFQSVYYDNDTNEVLEVNKTHCKATNVDTSPYTYTPQYHGWLTTDPLIIGPSAPLQFALKNINKVEKVTDEPVRNIPCEKWELKVQDNKDNFSIFYYFAPEYWTAPYTYKKYTPIRIHIIGTSARYTGDTGVFVEVNQITDFAFFKNSIEDLNDLQPPIGIGCRFRKKSDQMPDIPDTFKFSAELVDLLQIDKHYDVEVQFERISYDYPQRLARLDRYTKKMGFKSALYDFKGGVAYNRLRDGSCQISSLRNTEFVTYDLGMSGRMMTPKELMFLNGNFYAMGKRETRGIRCDTFESVLFNVDFFNQHFYKFVTTVYFIESYTRVGVDGEMESQIPAYMVVNGWSSPTNRTLSMQYSIYGFDDVIWPQMYSNFGLERCYTKIETKTYFVLILEVKAKEAARLEDQDDLVIRELRGLISTHARVPEHRIPFLKADYKSTGVYVAGVLLERPPALLQFYFLISEPAVTKDPDLKVIVEAETLEECSYACVDEGDFPCKGFYFCNRACFLKSTDPFEDETGEKERELGYCDEYIRAERESTNFGEAYLAQAVENLETAVLNQSVKIEFPVPNGEGIVTVQDIVVGDGPYIGVDAGDKPFSISVEWRKLDTGKGTTQIPLYAQTLTECYKRCKEAGGGCSSFSFCPLSLKEDKECLITPELVIKGKTPDTELVPDQFCNIYNPMFSNYFDLYPGKISLIPGDDTVRGVPSIEKCAETCRMKKEFVCRGFEYCRAKKVCTLHKKHILDFKQGETGSGDQKCVHYAARYIADYMDLGPVMIEDKSNVRAGTTLDECAKICSEELQGNCKSFNYCPPVDFTESSCALSKKLLRDDGITTTERKGCLHYEKRDVVHDWDKANTDALSKSGYTKKGFTGLVIGMLALGLIIGALGFILYSYIRSRGSGDGLAVRFMKNET